MNRIKTLLLVAVIALGGTYAFAQHEHHQPAPASADKPKPKSPRQSAMAMVGDNHVHVDYGSPSVRGRQIWNGLVAYDQVWATGAHKASWIDFDKDVVIEGQKIPAGKYGFFTIPNKDQWTLILSKTWDMHLADDYSADNDLIRIQVKPVVSTELTEALTYEVIAQNKKKGRIKMSWEYLSVAFDFQNQ